MGVCYMEADLAKTLSKLVILISVGNLTRIMKCY